MTENTQKAVLQRMTRSQRDEGAENPLTSSRAVRLALTKAANDSVGLVLTVSSVAEDISELDVMLEGLEDGLMLVGLHRNNVLVGLIALDMQLRAAVLEMETTGVLGQQVAEDRPPTHTDVMMCDAMITAFLKAFPNTVRGTDFDGWADDVTHHDRIDNTRMAGLLLEDRPYRVVRMAVQLGAVDRQGLLLMALPLIEVVQEVADVTTPVADWDTHFPQVVQEVSVALTAVLHRVSIPLSTAQNLQIGSVLPLTGCSVNSVRLVAPDGRSVMEAKLGQSGGMRAVRLQAAPPPDLQDFGTKMVVDEMGYDAAPGPALGFDGPAVLDEDALAEPDFAEDATT